MDSVGVLCIPSSAPAILGAVSPLQPVPLYVIRVTQARCYPTDVPPVRQGDPGGCYAACSRAAPVRAAPREGQPHLRRLYAILRSVAPDAQEAIKWGTPFFVEPRFLFAFSAHKAHLSFAPSAAALEAFREELEDHTTTKNFLKIPYTGALPEALIRRIAEHRFREVRERDDDAFW